MSFGKHIFRVGGLTAVSRVFGFIRDMMIARILGAGRLSDIFLAAFKLPNMFRDLLGEGALSAVFVPMFSDGRRDKKFANNVFSWLFAILLGITIVAQIAMPVIVWALAPGFADDPGKLELTVVISRIMFFYLIFICSAAFLSAVLNAYSRFAAAAFMPILYNLFLIGGLLAARYFAGDAVLFLLSIVVILSGIVQAGILWSRIRKNHFGLRLVRPQWNDKVKTLFKRLGVSIVGTGFYQINIIIGTLVASFQAGAVSWLYYSDRIVQLPFAIIGLAAGTVLLTTISDYLTAGDMKKIYAQQNAALRNSLMLTLPCMVGLFVLAHPIIRFLFQHGAWNATATSAVAAAIMVQVFALPAMTTSQIYQKTLYAAQDVRAPVKFSMIGISIGTIIYIAAFPFIGYLSIPAGTVASGWIRNFLLRRECKRRGLFAAERRTGKSVAFFTVWAALCGAALWLVPVSGIWALIGAIAGFGILYLPIVFLFNKKLN
jgi:putative peptidoglycan lipid II flippase